MMGMRDRVPRPVSEAHDESEEDEDCSPVASDRRVRQRLNISLNQRHEFLAGFAFFTESHVLFKLTEKLQVFMDSRALSCPSRSATDDRQHGGKKRYERLDQRIHERSLTLRQVARFCHSYQARLTARTWATLVDCAGDRC